VSHIDALRGVLRGACFTEDLLRVFPTTGVLRAGPEGPGLLQRKLLKYRFGRWFRALVPVAAQSAHCLAAAFVVSYILAVCLAHCAELSPWMRILTYHENLCAD